KLYQKVFLNGNKQERINFQKEFFITELNDFPSKKSYNHSRMNELRNGSIHKRKELFGKPFFKSFPVVVIATGHYPRNYGFDIERIFEVEWTKETIPVRNSWYNAHYSSDNKRMLIHTRQLSTSVSNDLINALSNEINNFLKQEISKSKLY